jgi:transposase
MSRKNKYIQLSEPEEITLTEGLHHHPKAEFRQKSNALLMSHKGLTISFIASFFRVKPHTIGVWFKDWETEGLCGLRRMKGQGRKSILKVSNQAHITALDVAVEKHYQDVERIKTDLESSLKMNMSKDTVKRFLKKIITHGEEFAAVPIKDKIK